MVSNKRHTNRTVRFYAGRMITWLGYVVIIFLAAAAINWETSLLRSGIVSDTTRDLITGGLIGFFGAMIMGWSRFVRVIGRRLAARTANEVLESDTRPPILFLRSFSVDEKKPTWAGLPKPSFEENLTKILSEVGPVIAIGQPHERLPPLGASRMYVNSGDWQNAVSQLILDASIVIIKVGVTEGLCWEISQIIQMVAPQRILIALPPPIRLRKKTVEGEFTRFRKQVGNLFPRNLPECIGSARWAAFNDDWSPRLLSPSPWRWILGEEQENREEIRSFCKALGYPLTRSTTVVSAMFRLIGLVFFSFMLIFSTQNAIEPVKQDLKNLLEPRELKSERATFKVLLPTGWSRPSKELLAQIPKDEAEDRLFAMHVQLGRGGFGMFALVNRFSKTQISMSLEDFSIAILKLFSNVVEGPTGPFYGAVGHIPARVYQLKSGELEYLVIIAETSKCFYYIKGWSQSQFFPQHVEEIKTLSSSLIELYK